MSHSTSLNRNNLQTTDRKVNIRRVLLEKTPDDLSRELPGLIEEIKKPSNETGETIRYAVGVSFSKSGSCFDYWLNQTVIMDGDDEYRTRVIKAPVTQEHNYVTFYYPPDPSFDGETLRGVLLAMVEEQNVSFKRITPDGDRNVTGRLIYAYHRIMNSLKNIK